MVSRCSRGRFAVLCLCTGPMLIAAAQAADSSPSGDVVLTETLDVITVVARPLLYNVPDVNFGALGTMKLQDIPFSLQSFSSQLIENQGSKTLLDVLKADPSVQDATTGGAYDLINIRGFPIDNSNTLRRNGMALAPYLDVPLESVERVDLLKGPSGFLYGVNAPGGTVNYFVKRPTAESFASATLELQDPGAVSGTFDVGGPINKGERFGYRAVVAGGRRGDFDRNRDYERAYAYGAFDWKLSDAAILQLDADFQTKEIAAQALIGNQPNGELPPFPDPETLLGQPWARYETSTYNINARLDYRFNDDWTLTNQAALSYKPHARH